MQKISSMPSSSANLGKQHGRGKIRRKDWTQKTEDPVGQSISCESYWKNKKTTILPLSIPLRFLSLCIYCTNTSLNKQLRTSHTIGKNNGKSIPLAWQILTAVMTTDGIVHVYIYLNGWGTHTTVNWIQPVLQSHPSRLFPKSVNQDCRETFISQLNFFLRARNPIGKIMSSFGYYLLSSQQKVSRITYTHTTHNWILKLSIL